MKRVFFPFFLTLIFTSCVYSQNNLTPDQIKRHEKDK